MTEPDVPAHPAAEEMANTAWRELGDTPTVRHRRPLDDSDPRWQVLCTRPGVNYYLREWVAYEADGYEHQRVEVGTLGPIKWSEQT